LTQTAHPAAVHHLPGFIPAPGETDIWMVVMGVVLILAVLGVGNLFLRLHTLPERMAHRGHKLQFEIVAVLGLLALFTHMHIFWVAGLLLALIDLPDFGTPLNRMAGSLEKIADGEPNDPSTIQQAQPTPGPMDVPPAGKPSPHSQSQSAQGRSRPVLAAADGDLTHA
jgi:hypothetical protein